MRKNRAESESQRKARLARIEWWWKKKFSWGGGDQFIPYNSQASHPDYFHGMISSDKEVFRLLAFIAWKNQSWKIDATADFIECGLGGSMKVPTILRRLKSLERWGAIRPTRGRYGQAFMIHPSILVRKSAAEMKFFLEASLEFAQIDPFDRSETAAQIDQNDRRRRSKRSISEENLSLEIDQNDRQYLDFNSSYSETPRHAPSNVPIFEKNSGAAFGRGRMSPDGQDQMEGEEGVGLSADEITRRHEERWNREVEPHRLAAAPKDEYGR